VLQEFRREEVLAEEEEAPFAVTAEGFASRGRRSYTQLAQCCRPNPDDPGPIVGYVTRGRGVTIHRWDCPNMLAARPRGRWSA